MNFLKRLFKTKKHQAFTSADVPRKTYKEDPYRGIQNDFPIYSGIAPEIDLGGDDTPSTDFGGGSFGGCGASGDWGSGSGGDSGSGDSGSGDGGSSSD